MPANTIEGRFVGFFAPAGSPPVPAVEIEVRLLVDGRGGFEVDARCLSRPDAAPVLLRGQRHGAPDPMLKLLGAVMEWTRPEPERAPR